MDLLDKYGLKPANAILAEAQHLPVFHELVEKYPVEYIAGGATQNSARVCQWMAKTPGAVTYIGAVGKDEYATHLREAATKDGMRVEYFEVDGVATGTCGVLVTGHERSLVANLGAAEKYDIAHVKQPHIWPIVEAASFYYIACFFMTHSVETILAVAQHANENNKVFMMNTAAPFIFQVPPFFENFKRVLPYIDILFGNDSEAEAMSDAFGLGTKDVTEIAKLVAAMPKIGSRARFVVITNGCKPTVIAASTGEVLQIPVIPIEKEKIVDTNGAGDSFAGGFLSQLIQVKE